ncbi:MAG: Hydroxypyruvate reductase [Parcubacteria group bacterium GW2011_GWA1_36_12]|nr:MAG: Hydroxypyruvate reductase [Parcubacteria group bacterium GW2011_GWA1_36_12]
MGYIKNYEALATSDERKIVLDLIEAAVASIQPELILRKNFSLQSKKLTIQDKVLNIGEYKRIFLIGFGKGSARIASIIERTLGDLLTRGYVIDVTSENFSKIDFTLGTHPLPSQANIDFTKNVVDKLSSLSEKDLVLILTCGGGSVMFEKPYSLTLDRMIEVNRVLLHSGADIREMNAVRKHLDVVKGGDFAKIVYPATVFNMIFSDVPGNDFSVIASGPTVRDKTTVEDALNVLKKYHIEEKLKLLPSDFVESPKDEKYFEKIENILMLSNLTALEAMEQKAINLHISAKIFSDRFQANAAEAGKKLIDETPPHSILLAGGETSLKITGGGEGGRNQHLVLAALPYISNGTVIASFDSDGWDNTPACGVIADFQTVKKAKSRNLDFKKYLDDNDSFAFFKAVGDAILTDRLPTNVSDLMIVLKK